MDTNEGSQFTELTAEIVAAYVSNNDVRREDIATLIGDVYSALQRAQSGRAEPEPTPQEPAVSVRKSVTPDYIVCLEDGRKFIAQAAFEKRTRDEPARISRQVGFEDRLSDGCSELLGGAI